MPAICQLVCALAWELSDTISVRDRLLWDSKLQMVYIKTHELYIVELLQFILYVNIFLDEWGQ